MKHEAVYSTPAETHVPIELHASVGVHVTEIVERGCGLRIGGCGYGQNFFEFGFGLVDVVADGVRLQAGNAIGSAATPLELMVNTVTASAGAGGIALTSEQSRR